MAIDGRYLSSHGTVTCPTCGPYQQAQVFVVQDRPIVEESRCANCQRTLTINGRRVTDMQEAVLIADGQGRR